MFVNVSKFKSIVNIHKFIIYSKNKEIRKTEDPFKI